MPKRLSVSVSVTVPDDPFAASAIYQKLQPAWSGLLEALKATGAPHDVHITEAAGVREKRKRGPNRPKLVQTPSAA